MSPDDAAPAAMLSVEAAAERLAAGGLVAFPTETVYGLGGDARSPAALAAIYREKGRPSDNPLIVHVADREGARACADGPLSPLAERLMAEFWPGPLTLVVPRSPRLPPEVSAGLATVALRAPAHPVAQRLLRACGLPLAAPSANPSERLSPTRAEHVLRGLPNLPLILDGGPCPLGLESTVVDLTAPEGPLLLRPGALPLRRLRQALPDLRLRPPGATGPAASPGLRARHYAPRARVVLVPDVAALALPSLPAPRGLLCREGQAPESAGDFAVIESLPADAEGFGADLFAALHRLDDAGVASIAVVLPPDDEDFAAARDRLQRAAAPG